MGPDIALAASARQWPDRLHRFLLDHGGGRIVERAMSADQAIESDFDVLLVDDVCSFLTPHLIARVKSADREVVGVFAPEDRSDAKRRLLECGISDVIEAEATPEEFLEKVGQTLAHRVVGKSESPPLSAVTVAVTGPCEGVGMTEVAVALAHTLSAEALTTLVDMDPAWPSVAQRLDLPLHPNVRTALDRAIHNADKIDEAVQVVDALQVVGGRADGGRGAPISRHDVNALVDGLSRSSDVVVLDAGPAGLVEGGLLREFDTVIVVGAAGPVGIARLIRTIQLIQDANRSQSLLAVVNQTQRSGFQRSEMRAEVDFALDGVPVVTLPFDRRLADAAWNGSVAMGSAFRRAVRSMADVVIGTLQ